jgi:RNA polymerase sigma-70 factor, ECF subfamily
MAAPLVGPFTPSDPSGAPNSSVPSHPGRSVLPVSTLSPPGTEPDPLLTAAVAGDRAAFDALAGPHLRAIQLHCYRMLGSYHDAQEAGQETLLRAWQSLPTYEGRAPLRHWLYRIATTTCLKALARRARQPVAMAELTDLEPYPDWLLDEPTPQDPAAQITRRESVALAFVAALQLLPPAQRAALILRDVLAFSAAESADLLDMTVPAINSALQRARATMRTLDTSAPARLPDAEERQLVDRFMRAWQHNDIPALAALLREDVILRMPPEALEFHTRALVAQFFATVPGDGHLDRILLRATAANGQPALAAYETQPNGTATAYGLMVLTITESGIAAITGFPDPALFDAFALPATES